MKWVVIMKDEDVINRLNEFTEYCSSSIKDSTKTYYVLGKDEKYVFLPTEESIQFISNRIGAHNNLKRVMITSCLECLGYLPEKCSFYPFRRLEISYPKELESIFGELIYVGTRIKLFNFKNGSLYTLPFSQEGVEELKKEILIRKEFENKINIPKLLSYDTQYAYMEEVIVGHSLKNLNKYTWPFIEEIFKQLILFYQASGLHFISFENKLNELEHSIQQINAEKELKKVVEMFIERLNPINKNVLITTIVHGDLHLGNILINNNRDKAYVIDWTSVREGLLFDDLFRLLFNYSLDSRDNVLRSVLLRNDIHGKFIYKILKKFDAIFSTNFSNIDAIKSYFTLSLIENAMSQRNPSAIKKAKKRLSEILPLLS